MRILRIGSDDSVKLLSSDEVDAGDPVKSLFEKINADDPVKLSFSEETDADDPVELSFFEKIDAATRSSSFPRE